MYLDSRDVSYRSELLRGAREARRLAAMLNVLHRVKLPEPPPQEEAIASVEIDGREYQLSLRHVAVLLFLHRVGGSAVLARLSQVAGTNMRQVLGLLCEMESWGLLRVITTPTRIGVLLTPVGERVASELSERIKIDSF